MGIFAKNSFTIFFVLLILGQYNAQDGVLPDNAEADSQILYRFVKVPSKKYKYIHPGFGGDYDIDFRSVPKVSYPTFTLKTSAPKSVFTPNDKFVYFANYHANTFGKNTFYKRPSYKKYPSKFRSIHPNFHGDLETTVKLPISLGEKQNFDHLLRDLNLQGFEDDFKLDGIPAYDSLEHDFLESASKKQVEKYYEDLQKEKEEQFKQKLLNDPDPAAKGVYQQYLKAKEDEKIEMEYVEQQAKKERQLGPTYYIPPIEVEERQVIKMSKTPGLSYYKTLRHDPAAYQFEVTL